MSENKTFPCDHCGAYLHPDSLRHDAASGMNFCRDSDACTKRQDGIPHHYPIELLRLTPEQGGGFAACIPALGRLTFTGCGDTVAEALASLEAIRTHLVEKFEAEGIELPPPPAVE